MPEESEFLCGEWLWDAALRELRHYPRRKKGHADTPDAVERLEQAKDVALYRWSQTPMMTATGDAMSGRQGRVEVTYVDGRKLTINEDDRECARRIADTLAASLGLTVREEGAPTGRRGGNLPTRDDRGLLRYNDGRTETVLDHVGGELRISTKKRFVGKNKRSYSTTEIRRLELDYAVRGPAETFTVNALVGPDEVRVPIAAFSGFEGWADHEEWREFTAETARTLGVEWRESKPA